MTFRSADLPLNCLLIKGDWLAARINLDPRGGEKGAEPMVIEPHPHPRIAARVGLVSFNYFST